MPYLIRRFTEAIFTLNPEVAVRNCRNLMMILGALCYFISPVDLLPEAAFGLVGLIDDFFVVFVISYTVLSKFHEALVAHNNRNLARAE